MHVQPSESFTIRTAIAHLSTSEPCGVKISGDALNRYLLSKVIVTLDKSFQGFEETWMSWILRDRQNEFPRGISDRLNHLPVIVQVRCDAIQLDKYTRYAGKGGALATVAGITSRTAIAR